MKKTFSLIVLLFTISVLGFSQQEEKIYRADADAANDLKNAIAQAQLENKHVLVQVGGNWCPWCLKLDHFSETDADIKQSIQNNYVRILINYSKENKNLPIMKQLDFPQRFGFPVLVILDQNGNRIHTQSTGYLEQDKAYNKKEVISFLKLWSPDALNPEHYK